jgi:hypothetical protein
MRMSYTSSKRILLICAATIVLADVLLALFVIPAVKTDSYPGAKPEVAVPAFWVNAGLSFILSVVCLTVALFSKGRSQATTTILVICGVVILLLGLLLIDAGSAFRSHGLSMQSASTIIFVCAALLCLSGLLVGMTAFLRPIKG